MKCNPAEGDIRARMRPGALSRDGFLGADERTLGDIISSDLAELECAGLTQVEVASFLDAIHRAADRSLGAPCELFEGAVTAQLTEVMGRIPCPFACGHRAHKAVVTARSGEIELRFTPLHVHLVEQHGFFQGRGSALRLEPGDVVRLFRRCHGAAG